MTSIISGVTVAAGSKDLASLNPKSEVAEVSTKSAQIYYATTLTDQAFPQTAGILSSVAFLLPFVLRYVEKKGIQNQTLNNSIQWIQNNNGQICKVAGLVSAAALTVLGNPLLGLPVLAFWGLDYLAQAGLITKELKDKIEYVTPYLRVGTAMLFGGVMLKLLTLAILAGQAYEQVKPQLDQIPLNQGLELAKQAKDYLKNVDWTALKAQLSVLFNYLPKASSAA